MDSYRRFRRAEANRRRRRRRAEALLDTRAHLRVARVRRALEEVWPGPELLASVAHAVTEAFGSEHVGIGYTRAPDGGLGAVGHTRHPPYDGWAPWKGAIAIPIHAMYALAGRDRWADVAVEDRRLYAGAEARREAFRSEVLVPNDVWHQLRVTLYENERFVGFFGVYRPRDAKPFEAKDEALLGAVVDELRSVFHVTSIFHGTNLHDAGVTAVLDALDRPAFLTSDDGAPVHANPAARMLPPALLPLVRAVARGAVTDHPFVRAQSVRVNGLRLRFVEWRAAPRAHPGVASLPPSLRRVGELMARGLTDKEIASALDLPLGTARTYAQRVLTRLGVDDRRKLMVLVGA